MADPNLHIDLSITVSPETLEYLDRMIDELKQLREALAAPESDAEPCAAETWSTAHFRQDLDPYWIRCTQIGTHAEHKDANTGLTWPVAPTDPPKENLNV